MPNEINPTIAHFHQGAIRMNVTEWEDIYKLLLKKRPELIDSFKRNTFLLSNDIMIIVKKEGCVFYDREACLCVLQKLLNIAPNCACIFNKPKQPDVPGKE